MPHRISIVLLLLAGCAWVCVGLFWMLDYSTAIGQAVLIGLSGLALAFRRFERLKGFSYTLWIITAVSLAMFYPQYFFTVGDFQLKRLIVPFVQLTMFGMGAHMSFEDFKGVVKMPKGVLIGIACHFIVMPLVGYTLSHLFSFPSEIAGGVILIGCVSSAMASNVMSYLAKANLALAVTIGACSTIISPFVTPFLMKWLAGQFVQVDIVHMMIDITNMIIIPIGAGFIFNLFYFGNETPRVRAMQLTGFAMLIMTVNLLMMLVMKSDMAELGVSLLKSFGWFYLLPMVSAIVFKNQKVSRLKLENMLSFIAMLGIVINTVIITASGRNNLLQVGGLLIISCLFHNLIGLSVGYFTALLFGLPERDRRTIAFEVGMQNGGVATGLALQMGKVATLGLASAIFGPLQNVTGSALANWLKRQPDENIPPDIEEL